MYRNIEIVLLFVVSQCFNVFSETISEHKHVHCTHNHPKADEVSNSSRINIFYDHLTRTLLGYVKLSLRKIGTIKPFALYTSIVLLTYIEHCLC